MDVAGIGTPYLDQLLSIETLPVTDHGARTLDSSWQYGGKVPTALVALARLGFTAAMHANVGGAAGRCIKKDFERHGVDCRNLRDVPGTHSITVVCLAEKSTGGRSFIGVPSPCPTPNVKASELDRESLLAAKWLLISDLEEASALAARWFKEAGKPVAIDGDSLDQKSSERFSLVDHLLISENTYAAFFGGGGDFEKNLRELRKLQRSDAAVAAVTLGAGGVAGIDEGGNYFRYPAHKVDVVDTTGAGDVFHGAYIAGKLEGMGAAEACAFAQAVSAVKCTKLGGRAGIPDRAQVREFIETGFYGFPELEERAAYYREPPYDRLL
ncbi:MAG: PfkB family carbohydrate kinase [Defluviitaleaceae bacterium]|nr:PfkB family carbohydrate kinase [Defluviitaleaceae bacterium]